MSQFKRSILPLSFLFLAIGCGGGSKNMRPHDEKKTDEYIVQNQENRSDEPAAITEETTGVMSDSVSVYLKDGYNSAYNPLGSSAAGYVGDSTRKFIKTADLKFRVNSTVQATYEIEVLTKRFKGFVISTRLESRVDGTNTIPVSPDSSLETVYYTVTNTMTIRVPHQNLDSFLRSFTPLVEFLDYRTIELQDVYLDLLRQRLTQQRIANYQKRVRGKLNSKGRNLNEINDTEEAILAGQEEADNAKIESLQLMDRIEYSTINLNIYQRQAIKRELVFNGKNIKAYEPGFGYQFKQSVSGGWNAFLSIILFFAQFWILLVIVIVVFIVVKLIKGRSK
jgi:Domain of unknown function (DUF4349)